MFLQLEAAVFGLDMEYAMHGGGDEKMSCQKRVLDATNSVERGKYQANHVKMPTLDHF